MVKVAIDLTWVRHNKVGGTESSIRNLLDGFSIIDTRNVSFFLLTSRDNVETFEKYRRCDCFRIVECNVDSCNKLKRVLWQNCKMRKVLDNHGITKCLEPVYSKPFWGGKKIDYYTTIHDLQALHYPEYFRCLRVLWMKISWWNAINTSKRIIAISDFVKEDIMNHYKIDDRRVVRIYDAISINTNEVAQDSLFELWGIYPKKYYFTVSSLLPHKNLKTLINALEIIKLEKSEYFYPLVISGVGGDKKDEIIELSKLKGLENDIIITPYLSDSVRNKLYSECRCFLFPSVFEGFGMPVIEAMFFGCNIITTKETCLTEISDNLVNYVSNPFDAREWVESICSKMRKLDPIRIDKLKKRYSIERVANSYLDLFIE